MTNDRLEALVLAAAEKQSGLQLSPKASEELLQRVAGVLFAVDTEKSAPDLTLSALIEGRLTSAMDLAYDALGVPASERPLVRFAREDEAGSLNEETYLPTLGPDDAVRPQPHSILFTNAAGAQSLSLPDDGGGGPATLALDSNGTSSGPSAASLTVVTIGRGVARVEKAILDSMPTAKRDAAQPSARGQDLLGEVLDGKYRIVKFIGRGGFGVVYKAIDISVGAEVAIKVLHPAMAMRHKANSNFTAEAQRLTKLKHQGVVEWKTYYPKRDGLSYLVMEFVDGEELSDVLEEKGKLDEATAGPVLLQILDALRAAHHLPGGEELLHLDLKPANVLMLRNAAAGRQRIKLIDFGIGQYSGDEEPTEEAEPISTGSGNKDETVIFSGRDSTHMGQTSVRRAAGGTALYASPEQCRHLRHDREITDLDGRSDIYSFGVLSYRVLTGEYPYPQFKGIEDSLRSTLSRGDAYMEAFRLHITEPPTPLRQLEPLVSRKLATLVERCLAKKPDDRFADTEEAYAAFQEVIEPRGKSAGLRIAAVLGVSLIIAGTLFNKFGKPASAAPVSVEIRGVRGTLNDTVQNGALVASAKWGPVFRLEGKDLDAAEFEDLAIISCEEDTTGGIGWLGDVQGVILDRSNVESGEFMLKFVDGATLADPVCARLRWNGGSKHSVPFELRLMKPMEWGDAPRVLSVALVGADSSFQSLLDEKSLPIWTQMGAPLQFRLDLTGDTGWVHGGEVRLFLGSSKHSVDLHQSSENGPFQGAMSSELMQSLAGAKGGSASMRFEATGLDGYVYKKSWNHSLPLGSALTKVGAVDLQLVEHDLVLQSEPCGGPSAVGGVLDGRLVCRGANKGRPTGLRLKVSLPTNQYGGLLRLENQDGVSVSKYEVRPSDTHGYLSVDSSALGSNTVDPARFNLVLEQSKKLLGDPAQLREDLALNLTFDPEPVSYELTLIQGGRDLELDSVGSSPVDVLAKPLQIELDGKWETLWVLESPGGEASPRVAFARDGDTIIKLDDLTAPEGEDPSEVAIRLRVWSAHEWHGQTAGDLERIANGLEAELDKTGQLSLEGLPAPMVSTSFTLNVLGKLSLSASLEGGTKLVFGEAPRDEDKRDPTHQRKKIIIKLVPDQVSGVVQLLVSVNDGLPKTLDRDAQGHFTFKAPDDWDEIEGNAKRALTFTLKDGLREKGQEFKLSLAFSSSEPAHRLEVPAPSSEVAWETDEESDKLEFSFTVTDSNEILHTSASLRLKNSALGQELLTVTPTKQAKRTYKGQFDAIPEWSDEMVELTLKATDAAGHEGSRSYDLRLGQIHQQFAGALNVVIGPEATLTTRMLLFKARKAGTYLFRVLPNVDAGGLQSLKTLQAARAAEGATSAWMDQEQNRVDYAKAAHRCANGYQNLDLEFQKDFSFYLDEHEVSVAQYRDFVDATAASYGKDLAYWMAGPHRDRSSVSLTRAYLDNYDDDAPVVGLTWFEASAYAAWAGKRLPTWFEWEFAMRGGGSSPREYAQGTLMGEAHRGANDAFFAWICASKLQPVSGGHVPLSAESVAHLGGNASEWTSTGWEDRQPGVPDQRVLLPFSRKPNMTAREFPQFAVVGGSIAHGRGTLWPYHDYLAVKFVAPHRRGQNYPSRDGFGDFEGADPVIGFRCAISATQASEQSARPTEDQRVHMTFESN